MCFSCVLVCHCGWGDGGGDIGFKLCWCCVELTYVFSDVVLRVSTLYCVLLSAMLRVVLRALRVVMRAAQ